MNELEHGAGAVAFSSGMAAVSASVMNIVQSGDEIISSGGIFGGTSHLFKEMADFGIITHYVKEISPNNFAAHITNKTKLLYVETIANPKLEVADIEGIAEIARAAQIPLFVDNTVATPLLFRPLEHGANVVVHSTTKMINGGNAVGGIVISGSNFNWDSDNFPKLAEFKKFGKLSYLARLRSKTLADFGACPSPFNIFLSNIGLDTLALRMENSCHNAAALASSLSDKISVNYPGLKSNPFHLIAKKQFGNLFGNIFTLDFGNERKAFNFLNNLNLAKIVLNIGEVRTLAIHPASTIYANSTDNEKSFAGVTAGLVRVSVGIEDIADLIEDFQKALNAL